MYLLIQCWCCEASWILNHYLRYFKFLSWYQKCSFNLKHNRRKMYSFSSLSPGIVISIKLKFSFALQILWHLMELHFKKFFKPLLSVLFHFIQVCTNMINRTEVLNCLFMLNSSCWNFCRRIKRFPSKRKRYELDSHDCSHLTKYQSMTLLSLWIYMHGNQQLCSMIFLFVGACKSDFSFHTQQPLELYHFNLVNASTRVFQIACSNSKFYRSFAKTFWSKY